MAEGLGWRLMDEVVGRRRAGRRAEGQGGGLERASKSSRRPLLFFWAAFGLAASSLALALSGVGRSGPNVASPAKQEATQLEQTCDLRHINTPT